MNAKLEVINALHGQRDWLELVHVEMGQGKEILLLLPPVDASKAKALARLCHAYGYHQPADLPREVIEHYEQLLDLNDFAAKEHGITSEAVYFLQPHRTESREVRLR
ncbi:MAG TPA: hypothetical protein VNO52_11335 [Methylomirabilota bacterium]|nr:hypothetical protein [Methylomirabilota bacterium]